MGSVNMRWSRSPFSLVLTGHHSQPHQHGSTGRPCSCLTRLVQLGLTLLPLQNCYRNDDFSISIKHWSIAVGLGYGPHLSTLDGTHLTQISSHSHVAEIQTLKTLSLKFRCEPCLSPRSPGADQHKHCSRKLYYACSNNDGAGLNGAAGQNGPYNRYHG